MNIDEEVHKLLDDLDFPLTPARCEKIFKGQLLKLKNVSLDDKKVLLLLHRRMMDISINDQQNIAYQERLHDSQRMVQEIFDNNIGNIVETMELVRSLEDYSAELLDLNQDIEKYANKKLTEADIDILDLFNKFYKMVRNFEVVVEEMSEGAEWGELPSSEVVKEMKKILSKISFIEKDDQHSQN